MTAIRSTVDSTLSCYIIGIEERKENNKTVIVRKAVERRDEASLLENTINQLDAEDCFASHKWSFVWE